MNITMETVERDALIIKLIKNDLVHARLVNGLMELNLGTIDYLLDLHLVIFELMGISEDLMEEMEDRYFRMSAAACKVPADFSGEAFEVLAKEVFEELQRGRVQRAVG